MSAVTVLSAEKPVRVKSYLLFAAITDDDASKLAKAMPGAIPMDWNAELPSQSVLESIPAVIWATTEQAGDAAKVAQDLIRAGCKPSIIQDAPTLTLCASPADLISRAKPVNLPVPRGTKNNGPPAEQDPSIVSAEHVGGPMPSKLLIVGTDMHAARLFAERHGKDIRYAREASWLVWDGQRWRIDEKAVMVANLAKESAESIYDTIRTSGVSTRDDLYKAAKLYLQKRAIEAVIWLARSEPGVPVELVTFDADPWILNVQNGIIDLRTGELSPHTREAKCTMIAGASYQQDAAAPRWSRFISEICLGNADLMAYLQRMCGYLLTANTGEQCLFFMHGGGSNGKTTFVETIMRVMGQYATAGEPDLLMTRKNQGIPADVAKLRGARAVFLNETNQGTRFDEAKLKNLTGGDTLEARFMRENFFTFRPTHKLILRGNHKPTVNGTDEGIWRRLRLIPFDLRLADADRDRTLEETLAAELSGILAWMVEGCLQWQRDGIQTPAVITEAVKEYREESDTMGRFLDEKCTIHPNRQIKAGTLYMAYREFCEETHERALSVKDFPIELEHRNLCIKRKKSNGIRLIEGIELAEVNNWNGRY